MNMERTFETLLTEDMSVRVAFATAVENASKARERRIARRATDRTART